MSSEMKLIMESWNSYINEIAPAPQPDPTVHDFIQAMAKYKGKNLKKILGISGKVLAAIAGGALIGAVAAPALATTVAGGIGAAATTAIAAGAGKEISEEMAGQIISKFAEKAPSMAKWMMIKVGRGIPDDQREPIDAYFDLDDELQAVITGGTGNSPLFKKFADELYKHHAQKLTAMDDPSDLNKPLKDFIAGTANEYLKKWLNRGDLGTEFKGTKINK
jgi:hypothetical protein|tara:strand:- start:87 stop:746 length:660 start_codon:yes stop_codon:yes gene_type:complete